MKLKIRVSPNAKKEGVERSGDVWRVKVGAPPKEGKANARLIEVLSDLLLVPKSSIRVVSGQTSKNKVVEISEEPKRKLNKDIQGKLI